MKILKDYWRFILVGIITAMTLMTSVPSAVNGQGQFAFDLYARLAAEGENLFFSPHSVSSALIMTWCGAMGRTERQMREILGIAPGTQAHQDYSETASAIAGIEEKGHIEIRSANSLWPQEGYPFRSQYLDIMKEYYRADITTADYAAYPESARLAINRWVEERTRERIRDLMGPGSVDADTRMVLVNAVYFLGSWELPFEHEATSSVPFFAESGDVSTCDMMSGSGMYRYTEDDGAQVLEMKYRGGDVSMVAVLPRPGRTLADLESSLQAGIGRWTSSMKSREVEVFFPRFRIEWGSRSLVPFLQDMGMTEAFGSDADFSGMAGSRGDLYISDVVHKAFVEVDETGTEAAAATGAVMTLTSMPVDPVPVFRADRPFSFFIRENRTGTILFMGRVADPAR